MDVFLPNAFIPIIIVRMAKAAKRLQAILDYIKKVKSITSTVFGQFS